MQTVEDILTAIFDYCSRPNSQKLLSVALTKLFGRATFYRNMLALTDSNWLVNSFFLGLVTDQNIYNISSQVADFGRPIMIETYDDTNNQNFSRRDINIVDIQNLDREYQGRDRANTLGGTHMRHSAVAMAFYGMPERFMRVVPTPSQSATYRVFYEPSQSTTDPRLNQMIQMMPNFYDLLAVHTALLLLPDCEWIEFNGLPVEQRLAMNSQKAKVVASALEPELTRLQTVFTDYRLNNKHEQTITRKPFNSYRRGGGGRTRWGY